MINKISWIGTISSVFGSFVLAFGFILLGYSSFLVGSISWLTVGIKTKNKPLITLNGCFLLANVIGFTRSIL